MNELLITAVVFFSFYQVFKLLSDHILKSKLIKLGHIEKVGILEPTTSNEETNKYPSLKWGLVALMTGIGFIIIEVLRIYYPETTDYRNVALPVGILLVFMSLGFLTYFFIMNRITRNR